MTERIEIGLADGAIKAIQDYFKFETIEDVKRQLEYWVDLDYHHCVLKDIIGELGG